MALLAPTLALACSGQVAGLLGESHFPICIRLNYSGFGSKSILLGTRNEVHQWLLTEGPTMRAL